MARVQGFMLMMAARERSSSGRVIALMILKIHSQMDQVYPNRSLIWSGKLWPSIKIYIVWIIVSNLLHKICSLNVMKYMGSQTLAICPSQQHIYMPEVWREQTCRRAASNFMEVRPKIGR